MHTYVHNSNNESPCQVGFVVSVSASRTVGREFASRPGHTKDHHKNGTGSVWNCLWGHALKKSPGINRKSRVSYPGPGFLSSATWPSLSKKHYNGLNQTKPIMDLLQELALIAEQHIEATEPPLFLQFINLLINDAIFLLDEALSVSIYSALQMFRQSTYS